MAGAVSEIPLEYIDDTLNFNPESGCRKNLRRGRSCSSQTDDDRLVPPEESEALYARAGEPKKLVVLKGFGHYDVYIGEALNQVMEASLDWCRSYRPAKSIQAVGAPKARKCDRRMISFRPRCPNEGKLRNTLDSRRSMGSSPA